MRKTLITLAFISPLVSPAQMVESMKAKDPWRLYVFVSSSMPTQTVVSLARDASRTRATLVLRGFPDSSTVNGAREYVEKINQACCDKKGPGWIVNPKLFESFAIKSVPAFVLTQTDAPQQGVTSVVSGDMAIANALKFFTQESRSSAIRTNAMRIYDNSFRGQ
jgi:type-F conjugative transfer system pilin assembly protein TrbC